MTALCFCSILKHPQPTRSHSKSFCRPGLALILIIGSLIPLLVTSCKSALPKDPVAIVQAAYDRLSEGDVDGFMKFFSDDAVQISPGGRFAGPEAIREHMEQLVSQHYRFELRDLSSNGYDVTYASREYQNDTYITSDDDGLTVVVDDRIIFDGTKTYRLQECTRDPSQAFCQGN
jgi:ketosteroid isomerase-like protein